MKFLFAVLFLVVSGQSFANDPVCLIAQIENGAPKHYQQKVIGVDNPTELETTNGLFRGRVFVQQDNVIDAGLSIMLMYKDIKSGGFFEAGVKTPVVYLFADGMQAQINCWLE